MPSFSRVAIAMFHFQRHFHASHRSYPVFRAWPSPCPASKSIFALPIDHTQFFARGRRHVPLPKALFTLPMVRIALSNHTLSAFYCSSVSISIFYAFYRLYLIFECSHSPTSASKKHFNASYKPRSNLLYLISAASNALNTPPIKNEANGPHSGSSAPVLSYIHFPVTRIARRRLPPHPYRIAAFRRHFANIPPFPTSSRKIPLCHPFRPFTSTFVGYKCANNTTMKHPKIRCFIVICCFYFCLCPCNYSIYLCKSLPMDISGRCFITYSAFTRTSMGSPPASLPSA